MANGTNDNSEANEIHISHVSSSDPRHITVTVTKKTQTAETDTTEKKTTKKVVAPKPDSLNDQRLAIYHEQLARQKTPKTAPFPIETHRDALIELKRFDTAVALDRRGIEEMDALYTGFDHLYLVDDLIQQIVADLPEHTPYGWEATSRVQNHLNLPTVGALPRTVSELGDNQSIIAYALTHFGVASYTNDRAIFIGNIAGYLLMSYFFAHLKIQYGVTPLRAGTVVGFDYSTPTVASNTQNVANLSLNVKKKIYQLAVFCGQISLYSVDKAIEKMLITEVNDFDKKKEQKLLQNLLRYGG